MDPKGRLAEIKTILSKYRILVVEDVDNARALYCGELQKRGYLVDGARNLEEALSRLEARTYHVAVVDIMLAGEHDQANRDGLVILKAIKESRLQIRSGREKINAGTRSIALTGQDEPQLAFEFGSIYGANDYIDKDKFKLNITDELIKRVERQINEGELSLYGDKNVISYLAGPANEGAWVDRSLRLLQVKGGYDGLTRFFSALCDPIAPLVAQKGAQNPTEVNAEMGIVTGKLWSKALALPIMLVVGHGEIAIESLRSKISELDPDALLAGHSGQGLTGQIFELKNFTRSEFKSSVS